MHTLDYLGWLNAGVGKAFLGRKGYGTIINLFFAEGKGMVVHPNQDPISNFNDILC